MSAIRNTNLLLGAGRNHSRQCLILMGLAFGSMSNRFRDGWIIKMLKSSLSA